MADEEEDISLSLIPDLYKPPALLPIAQLKDQLLYTIETHPVTIVVGETGSGKKPRPSYMKQVLMLCLHLHRQNDADPQISPPGRVVQQWATSRYNATQKNRSNQRGGESCRRT